MTENLQAWNYLERRAKFELSAALHQGKAYLGMDAVLRGHEC